MVKLSLRIRATLENIDVLYTSHPNFSFALKLKCLNCGEQSKKWHDVIESQTFESKTKHDKSHFLAKCKLCGRENTLSIIPGSNSKFSSEDATKFQSIVIFDCRGIEPTDFAPGGGWIAKAKDSSTVFANIDLTEKEWSEYDDNTKNAVGIYEFQHEFLKVK